MATGPSLSHLSIHRGKIPQSILEARHLRPFWNSFPLPEHKPSLVKQLRQLGYQLLNGADDHPDSFTIVHLAAGPEQLFASVKLAVDGELEELTQQADSRVSKESIIYLSRVLCLSYSCHIPVCRCCGTLSY